MGDFKGRGGFGGPKGGDRGGDRRPNRDFGNRPRFDNNRAGGGYGGGQQTMHKATCSDCGNTCEVPFRPTGEKPVYCNDCFGKHKGADAGGFNKFEKKDFGGRRDDRGGDRKPEGRPVENASMHDLKRKVDDLHVKLDKVLAHMNAHLIPVTPAKKEQSNFVPQAVKKAVTAKKNKMDKKEVKKIAKAPKVTKKVPAKKKK